MCQRIAQFLGTRSALGTNTDKRFVQSLPKVNIKWKYKTGKRHVKRADKELPGHCDTGSERGSIRDNCSFDKGYRQETFMCTRQRTNISDTSSNMSV